MKKLFVVLALAGMVGSVSATTISTVNHRAGIVSIFGDKDKDKKKEKKEKSCKKDGTCCKDKKEGGACCKDKKAAAAPADAPKN